MAQTWEYTVAKLAPNTVVSIMLNQIAEDGWELVSVVAERQDLHVCYFKRPKVTETEPIAEYA
jgi:hypothetical protein